MMFWPTLSKGQSPNHFWLLVVELRTRNRPKLKAEVNHEQGEGVVAKDHLGLVLSWLRDQQEEVKMMRFGILRLWLTVKPSN